MNIQNASTPAGGVAGGAGEAPKTQMHKGAEEILHRFVSTNYDLSGEGAEFVKTLAESFANSVINDAR